MTTTIGSQTNVPDPGSPITSPWAQDTARKIVHTFANAAARDAWATRPDGAVCYLQDTDTLYVYRTTGWEPVLSQVQEDARFVNVAGDMMTGTLTISGGANLTIESSSWGQVLFYEGATRRGWIGKHNTTDDMYLAADATNVVINGVNLIAGVTNVLCGKQAPASTSIGTELASNGRITSTTDTSVGTNIVSNINNAVTGDWHMSFRRNNTEVGSVKMNGTTGVSFNTTSDANWKDVAGDVDAGAALDRLRALHPVVYRWRIDGDGNIDPAVAGSGELEVGLLAQEVATVVPYAVSPGAGEPGTEGYVPWGLDYGRLTGELVAALQAAVTRIDELSGRLEALEAVA